MVKQRFAPVITGTVNIAYVADLGTAGSKNHDQAIFRVDLRTGDRRVLSHNVYAGDGPFMENCLDVIVDGDYLYALCLKVGGTPFTQIMKIDRETGDREVFLETTEIVGQNFIDDGTSFIINGLDESFTYALHSVDKTTKAITGPIGTNPATQALGVTKITGTGKYYVSGDLAPGKVWEVNLGTGVYTDVSAGTGPEIDQPYSIDNFGGLIYIANENDSNLLSLDPATGNKTLLPFSTGVVSVNRPVSIKVKDAETLYFNTAYPGGSFLHEHTYSGASAGFTKIISGAGQGTGVEFIRPFGMALSTVAAGQPF